MVEVSAKDAARHDKLLERGWQLAQHRVVLHGEHCARLGWFARWQLRRAIRCYEEVLRINPQNWAAMWGLGKIYQRLGNHELAFEWFVRSSLIAPDQVDVAREASIAAMDSARIPDALHFSQRAVDLDPNDPGLLANLALAYCLAGNDEAALGCATQAVDRDPRDRVSIWVKNRVTEVAQGVRPRPERFPFFIE